MGTSIMALLYSEFSEELDDILGDLQVPHYTENISESLARPMGPA